MICLLSAGSIVSSYANQIVAQLPIKWRQRKSFLVCQPTDYHSFSCKYLFIVTSLPTPPVRLSGGYS